MAYVNLLTAMYPVGSLYFSTTSTSPANIIGGTWSSISNACIAAQGTIYGSAASYSGSDIKVPSHAHDADASDNMWKYMKIHIETGISGKLTCSAGVSGASTRYGYLSDGGYDDLADSSTTDSTGLNISNGAVPPYHFSCYVWYRTA